MKKNLKLISEESRGMVVAQTKDPVDPQRVEGGWIFSGKIIWITGTKGTSLWNRAMTSFAFRIFHLMKSYDWHTDAWQRKSLSEAL